MSSSNISVKIKNICRLLVLFIAAILLTIISRHTANADFLSIAEVSAPAINCVFDIDCTITVDDFSDTITLPGATNSGFLQSRLLPRGELGTLAENLYPYEYRIDLEEMAGIVDIPCVTSFNLRFGPVVPLDYDGDGLPEDVYVITGGGAGSVKPTAVDQTGDELTFFFSPAVCVGSFSGDGDSSFLFGLTSFYPPHPITATINVTDGTVLDLEARAPTLITTPTLIGTPEEGFPGLELILNGYGYLPGEYIGTIRWDGEDVSTFDIPMGGSFTVPFTIPPDATPGIHVITVCAYSPCITGEFEQLASINFEVLPYYDPLLAVMDRLDQESQRLPRYELENGMPRFVSLEIPVSNATNDPVAQALLFLDSYSDLYQLENPSQQLFLDRLKGGENGVIAPMFHVFFGQHKDNVPVFGSALAVHIEDGAITSSSGRYLRDIPDFPPAVLTVNDAEAFVQNLYPDGRIAGESKQILYNGWLIGEPQDETHLSWRVIVRGANFGKQVFLDAHSGEVLLTLEEHEDGDRPDEDFTIKFANTTTSTNCWERTAVEWFNEDGPTGYPGTGSDTNNDGQNANSFTHQVYHYFYDTFGRRSWNNYGEQAEIMVDILNLDRMGIPRANAFYDPGCNHIKFTDNMVTLDIMGHEWTHAIDRNEAGLVYRNQSGALDESFADFFGSMMDGDWQMGEGSVVGIIRDMSTPPAYGDPDHMSLLCSATSDYCSFALDNGGVHTNSGVPNKVAYLLTDGDIHNGITIRGLGRADTQKLYYDVHTTRLRSNSQFADARNEMIEQAEAYVRMGISGWTSADVCNIRNAWASVGLGTVVDLDCDGTPDAEDSDTDGDRILDVDDNCVFYPNPSQTDTDEDDQGDACDPDDDNDGRVDNVDNCPLVNNPGQEDDDFDGIGDVCDDDDGDHVMNPDDNCRFNYNPWQEDNDGDGVGDICDPDDDNDNLMDIEDNCPFTANPDQEDSDGDGIGDACDNCRDNANPDQADTDEDGIGNVCDGDLDGDGILNIEDNCIFDYNPYQIDIDGNLIGLACDPDERFLLSPPENILDTHIRFIDPEEPVLIPIFPCLVDGCGPWYLDPMRVNVEVGLPFEMPVQIVNDMGMSVARADIDSNPSLIFTPDMEFFFQSPIVSDQQSRLLNTQAAPFQGRDYYLAIYPTEEIEIGKSIPLQLSVDEESNELPFQIYLPIVMR